VRQNLHMLPVAELHLHIEGTLEPELLVQLAARNGVPLPATDLDELRARYRFGNLRSFLDLYYACMRVLRTEQDFYDLAAAYLTRAEAAGVRRAEIFFDPQSHIGAGVPIEAVFGGLTAALADSGISAELILCFLRDLGPDAAMETLRAALPFRDKFIGVGLDSAEVGHPPALFRDVYRRAAAEGLRLVAHAAEEGPPRYVHEALDELAVERIDHGVRSMEDPALVARLREERIPLTVCPLSNVALRVVGTLREHMLPAMLQAGLLVTVNSDDPAYFGGYVDDNFAAVQEVFGLSDEVLARLAKDSFDASFAPEPDKLRWRAEVDAWLAARARAADSTAAGSAATDSAATDSTATDSAATDSAASPART
jgi:adenosine deaminase